VTFVRSGKRLCSCKATFAEPTASTYLPQRSDGLGKRGSNSFFSGGELKSGEKEWRRWGGSVGGRGILMKL
jgi:hypothetical protein